MQIKFRYLTFDSVAWQPFVECWFTKILISDFDNIAMTSSSFADMKKNFIAQNGTYISFDQGDVSFNTSEHWIDEFEMYIDKK